MRGSVQASGRHFLRHEGLHPRTPAQPIWGSRRRPTTRTHQAGDTARSPRAQHGCHDIHGPRNRQSLSSLLETGVQVRTWAVL